MKREKNILRCCKQYYFIKYMDNIFLHMGIKSAQSVFAWVDNSISIPRDYSIWLSHIASHIIFPIRGAKLVVGVSAMMDYSWLLWERKIGDSGCLLRGWLCHSSFYECFTMIPLGTIKSC